MFRISLKALSTKNLGDLGQRTSNLITPLLAGILKDNPVAANLQQKNEAYQAVVIRKTFSGKGEDLAQQDLVRDKIYRSVRRLLRAYTSLPDAARKANAEGLLEAFALAGSIRNLNYGAQNTVMRKLIGLLETDENKARIETLGMTADVATLVKSQTDFEALADLQTDENSALRQMKTASGTRHELEDALRDFFALTSAMKNVTVWDDLYHDLKEIVKELKPLKGKKKEKPNESVANEEGQEKANDEGTNNADPEKPNETNP